MVHEQQDLHVMRTCPQGAQVVSDASKAADFIGDKAKLEQTNDLFNISKEQK